VCVRGRSSRPRVTEAIRRAKVEQEVEDYNGQLRLEGGAVFGPKAGRFIVMPITELLDPPKGTVLHGKLQCSDKAGVQIYLPMCVCGSLCAHVHGPSTTSPLTSPPSPAPPPLHTPGNAPAILPVRGPQPPPGAAVELRHTARAVRSTHASYTHTHTPRSPVVVMTHLSSFGPRVTHAWNETPGCLCLRA
jgi:hypothetical protein